MRLSLPVVLFLIFLTLKLAEVGVVATWSWIWIFAPLWIPFALVLGIYAFLIFGAIFGAIFVYFAEGKK